MAISELLILEWPGEKKTATRSKQAEPLATWHLKSFAE